MTLTVESWDEMRPKIGQRNTALGPGPASPEGVRDYSVIDNVGKPRTSVLLADREKTRHNPVDLQRDC